MAKKILLADDSITIQKVISITFASENYELIIVGDGESALKRAKEARPDLIMADVAMPGKNGYEVCEAVKNDPALSSTPVLLLAGTFEPLDRSEFERVGADDSIVKPFESQQLLNKVAELLSAAPGREAAPPAEAPARESSAASGESEAEWGNGDFIGFPEEVEEKPAIAGADQLPDLDFLDNGGVFEEPEKDLSAGDEYTDLDLDESRELGEPFTSAPSWQKDTAQEASIEPEPAVEAAPEEPAAPAEEPVKPFWAENVSREDSFAESKDISEFPDLYEDASEEPAAPEAPAPSIESAEEESFEKSFEDVEASFGGSIEEERVTAAEVEPGPSEAAPFESRFGAVDYAATEAASTEEPAVSDEAVEEPQTTAGFEPAVPAYAAPERERVEEAVAEKAAERLRPIEVPREELEDAVRKAVREVVQEIAWEVVPELAEELIKEEIDKVKAALSRLK